MYINKVLAGILIILMFAMTAQAEQPMAAEYRQILQSGTYYVEYSIREYKEFPDVTYQRVYKPGVDDAHDITSMSIGSDVGVQMGTLFAGGGMPAGTGVTYAVSNSGNNRLQNLKKIVKKGGWGLPIPFVNAEVGGSKKAKYTPRIMYQNGKYYRFSAGTDMVWSSWLQDSGDMKNVQALVLSENDMKSPELNLSEGWGTIRKELALPQEFSIFNFKDTFDDYSLIVQSPVFQESTQCTIKKDTYECDKYMAKEKNEETGRVDSVMYYALYKEDKLFLIQKYILQTDGSEKISKEVYVRNMSGQLPSGAFSFAKPIPVFAAGMGDVNDFLGIPTQVGTLGGNSDGK
ncbi:hypothetical protein [Selenomonas sp. AE3005]|uniref:hypothetical protein n=1 Tax=Selenomonas sp. AE3005 TaxID=1485543 RepID=UPI0025E741A1|nr:hypothetical protein [Selenomonas sp. AE3005]